MRKIFLCSLLCLFGFTSSNLFAQVTVSFGSGSTDPGMNVSIDVQVSNFVDITTMQYSVHWDPDVLEYVSVSNVTDQLPDFTPTEANFSTSVSGMMIDGFLGVSWNDPIGDPNTLANNTVIYTINFAPTGMPCDETTIFMNGDPIAIEFGDENFENIGGSDSEGTVSINGTDCGGGGGGDDLTINVPMIEAQPGSQVCLPITVANFSTIEAAQGSFNWDQTILEYVSLTSSALSGMTVIDNGVDDGHVQFLWFDNTGMNPVTLADGDELMELCFNVLGTVGQMSNVNFTDDPLEIEFNDGDVVDVVEVNNGKVIIVDMPQDPVKLICSDESGSEGSNVCVMFTVQDFDCVNSIECTFMYDDALLDWTGSQAYNLPGLDATDYNETSSGNITFTWNTPNGNCISEDDNTKIFELCFDLIGDCGNTSTIQIKDLEISNETVEVSSEAMDGSIEITCTDTCEIEEVRVDDVQCFGENTGNIIVSLTIDPDSGCECVWTLPGGQEITRDLDDCNLTSVGAGSYSLRIDNCSDNSSCPGMSEDFEIEGPDAALAVDGTEMDAGCEDDGSINVTISGGTPNYSVTWSSTGTSIPDGETNPTGLEPGTYTIMVDDANNCGPVSKEFVIARDIDTNVTFDVSKDDISCFGEMDGSITVDMQSISGGCPDYTVEISGGSFTNLGPDTYTITVTDALGNSNTDVVEIIEPDELVVAMDGIVTQSSSEGMANGSIKVTWMGGTSPYSLSWNTDGTPIADSQTSGNMVEESVAAGNYVLTITDANNCEFVTDTIKIMDVIENGSIEASVNVTNGMDNNGFDLACFGDMDASIMVNINVGLPTYTAVLSGAASDMIVTDETSFQFDNLGAGSYNLTINNANGDTPFDTSFVITEPDPLEISIDDSGGSTSQSDNCDGFIDVEVMGGVEDYVYDWGGTLPDQPNQDDLCPGFYNVFVTDVNGCQVMLSNIEVPFIGGPPVDPCYIAALVITPNGDNKNEFFQISCVDSFPNVLTIYDRWGRIVYSQTDYNNTWNGLDSDLEELPESAYMWVLEVNPNSTDTRLFKGTVTLLRD